MTITMLARNPRLVLRKRMKAVAEARGHQLDLRDTSRCCSSSKASGTSLYRAD